MKILASVVELALSSICFRLKVKHLTTYKMCFDNVSHDRKCCVSGLGAVWLARCIWDAEVTSSSLVVPITNHKISNVFVETWLLYRLR